VTFTGSDKSLVTGEPIQLGFLNEIFHGKANLILLSSQTVANILAAIHWQHLDALQVRYRMILVAKSANSTGLLIYHRLVVSRKHW
jgi:hypothetical protein